MKGAAWIGQILEREGNGRVPRERRRESSARAVGMYQKAGRPLEGRRVVWRDKSRSFGRAKKQYDVVDWCGGSKCLESLAGGRGAKVISNGQEQQSSTRLVVGPESFFGVLDDYLR